MSSSPEIEVESKAISFTAYVSFKGETREKAWEEKYTAKTADPVKYMAEMIERFNETLRPGEKSRTLHAVSIHGKVDPMSHDWEKQNLVTIEYLGRLYDVVKCMQCGITGKRHGVSMPVRDHKFRAEVYRRCDLTKAHLAKRAKQQ